MSNSELKVVKDFIQSIKSKHIKNIKISEALKIYREKFVPNASELPFILLKQVKGVEIDRVNDIITIKTFRELLGNHVLINNFVEFLKKRYLTSITKRHSLTLYQKYFDPISTCLPLTELLEHPDIDWNERKQIILIKHHGISKDDLEKGLIERFINYLRSQQIFSIHLMEVSELYFEKFDPNAVDFPIELIQQYPDVKLDPIKNILWTNVRKMPQGIKVELENLPECVENARNLIEFLISTGVFYISFDDALKLYRERFEISAITLPLTCLSKMPYVDIDHQYKVINIETNRQLKTVRKFVEHLKNKGTVLIHTPQAFKIYQEYFEPNALMLPIKSLQKMDDIEIDQKNYMIIIKNPKPLENVTIQRVKKSPEPPREIYSHSGVSESRRKFEDANVDEFIQFLRRKELSTLRMDDALEIYQDYFDPQAVALPLNSLSKVNGVVIDHIANIIKLKTQENLPNKKFEINLPLNSANASFENPKFIKPFIEYFKTRAIFTVRLSDAFRIYKECFDRNAVTLPLNRLLEMGEIKVHQTNNVIEFMGKAPPKITKRFVKHLKGKQRLSINVDEAFRIYKESFDPNAVALPIHNLQNIEGVKIKGNTMTIETGIVLTEPSKEIHSQSANSEEFIQFLRKNLRIDDALKIYQKYFDPQAVALPLNNLSRVDGIEIDQTVNNMKFEINFPSTSANVGFGNPKILTRFIEYFKSRAIFTVRLSDAFRIYKEVFDRNAVMLPLKSLLEAGEIKVDPYNIVMEIIGKFPPKITRRFVQHLKEKQRLSINVDEAFKIYKESFDPNAVALPIHNLQNIEGVRIEGNTITIDTGVSELRSFEHVEEFIQFLRKKKLSPLRIDDALKIYQGYFDPTAVTLPFNSLSKLDGIEIDQTANIIKLKTIENLPIRSNNSTSTNAEKCENPKIIKYFIVYFKSRALFTVRLSDAFRIYQKDFDRDAVTLPLNSLLKTGEVEVDKTNDVMEIIGKSPPKIMQRFVQHLKEKHRLTINVDEAFKIYKNHFDPNAVALPIHNLQNICGVKIEGNTMTIKTRQQIMNEAQLNVSNIAQTQQTFSSLQTELTIASKNIEIVKDFVENLKNRKIFLITIPDALKIYQRHFDSSAVTLPFSDLRMLKDVRIYDTNNVIEIILKRPPRLIRSFLAYLENKGMFSISINNALRIYREHFDLNAVTLPLSNLQLVKYVSIDEANNNIEILHGNSCQLITKFLLYLENRGIFSISIDTAFQIYQEHFDSDAVALPFHNLLAMSDRVTINRADNMIKINPRRLPRLSNRIKNFIQYLKKRGISSINSTEAFKIYQEKFDTQATSLPLIQLSEEEGVQIEQTADKTIVKINAQMPRTQRQPELEELNSASSLLSSVNSLNDFQTAEDFIEHLRSSQVSYITVGNALRIYRERFDPYAESLPVNNLLQIEGVEINQLAGIIILKAKNQIRDHTRSPVMSRMQTEQSPNDNLEDMQIAKSFVEYFRSRWISYISQKIAFEIYQETFDPNAVTLPFSCLLRLEGVEIDHANNGIIIKTEQKIQKEANDLRPDPSSRQRPSSFPDFNDYFSAIEKPSKSIKRFVRDLKVEEIFSISVQDALTRYRKYDPGAITLPLCMLTIKGVELDPVSNTIKITKSTPLKKTRLFITYLLNKALLTITVDEAFNIYREHFDPEAVSLPFDDMLKNNAVKIDRTKNLIQLKPKPGKAVKHFIEFLKTMGISSISVHEAHKMHEKYFCPIAVNLFLHRLKKIRSLVELNLTTNTIKLKQKEPDIEDVSSEASFDSNDNSDDLCVENFIKYLQTNQILSINTTEAFKIYKERFAPTAQTLPLSTLSKLDEIEIDEVNNIIKITSNKQLRDAQASENPCTAQISNYFKNTKKAPQLVRVFIRELKAKDISSITLRDAFDLYLEHDPEAITLPLSSMIKVRGVELDQKNNIIKIKKSSPTKKTKSFIEYLLNRAMFNVTIDEAFEIYREHFDSEAVGLPLEDLSKDRKLEVDRNKKMIKLNPDRKGIVKNFIEFLKIMEIFSVSLDAAFKMFSKYFGSSDKNFFVEQLKKLDYIDLDLNTNMIKLTRKESINISSSNMSIDSEDDLEDTQESNNQCILEEQFPNYNPQKDIKENFVRYLKEHNLTNTNIDEILKIYQKLVDPSAVQLPINDLIKISGVIYDRFSNKLRIIDEETKYCEDFVQYLKNKNIFTITTDEAFRIYKDIFNSTAQNLPIAHLSKIPDVDYNSTDHVIKIKNKRKSSNVCTERMSKIKNFLHYLKNKNISSIKVLDAFKIYKEHFDSNAVILPLYGLLQLPEEVRLDRHNDILYIKNAIPSVKSAETATPSKQDADTQKLLAEIEHLRTTLLTKFIKFLSAQQIFNIDINEAFKIYKDSFDPYAKSFPLDLASKLNLISIDHKNNRIIINDNETEIIEQFITYLKDRNLLFITIDDALNIYREHFDSTATQLPIEQFLNQTNIEIDKLNNLLKIRTNEYMKLIKKYEHIDNISTIIDFIQYLRCKKLNEITVSDALKVYRQYFKHDALSLPMTSLKQLEIVEINPTNTILTIKSKKDSQTLNTDSKSVEKSIIDDFSKYSDPSISPNVAAKLNLANLDTHNRIVIDDNQSEKIEQFLLYLKTRNLLFITTDDALNIYREHFDPSATQLPTDQLLSQTDVEFDQLNNLLKIRTKEYFKLIKKYEHIDDISTIIDFILYLRCKKLNEIPVLDAIKIYRQYFKHDVLWLPMTSLKQLEMIEIDPNYTTLTIKPIKPKKRTEASNVDSKSVEKPVEKSLIDSSDKYLGYVASIPSDFASKLNLTDTDKNNQLERIEQFLSYLKNRNLLFITIDDALNIYREHFDPTATQLTTEQLLNQTNIELDRFNNLLKIRTNEHIKLIKKYEYIDNISTIIDFIQFLRNKKLNEIHISDALKIYRQYFKHGALCLPMTSLKQLEMVEIDPTNTILTIKSKKKDAQASNTDSILIEQLVEKTIKKPIKPIIDNSSKNLDFINHLKSNNIYYITETEAFKIYRTHFVQTSTQLPVDEFQRIPGVEYNLMRNILTIKSTEDLKLIRKYAYVDGISNVISFLRFLKCKYLPAHTSVPLMDAYAIYQKYFDEYATCLPLATLNEIEEIEIDRINHVLQLKKSEKRTVNNQEFKICDEDNIIESPPTPNTLKDTAIVQEFEQFIKEYQLLNVKINRAFNLFLDVKGYRKNNTPLITFGDLSTDIKIDEKQNIIEIRYDRATNSSNVSSFSSGENQSNSIGSNKCDVCGTTSSEKYSNYLTTMRAKVKAATKFIQYFKERKKYDIDINQALQQYSKSGRVVNFRIETLPKVAGVTIENNRIKIQTYTEARGINRIRTRTRPRTRRGRNKATGVTTANAPNNTFTSRVISRTVVETPQTVQLIENGIGSARYICTKCDDKIQDVKLKKSSNICTFNGGTFEKIYRKRVKLIVTHINHSYCDNFNRYIYINEYGCLLCDTKFSCEIDKSDHERKLEHMLREKYRTDRKFFLFQKSNVQICFNTTEVKEEIVLNHNRQMVRVEVRNITDEDFKLQIIELVPNKNVSIINNFMEEEFILRGQQSVSVLILITCSKPTLILYPVLILLQNENGSNFDFTLKDLVFRLQSPHTDEIVPTIPYKYTNNVYLTDDEQPVIFEAPLLTGRENGLVARRMLPFYDMSNALFKLLNVGLKNTSGMTPEMRVTLRSVNKVLSTAAGTKPKDSLNEQNYTKMLKLLLYFEEHQLLKEMSSYNQIGKHLRRVNGKKDILELEVGNLLEQRPSIMPYDRVIVRKESNPDFQYQGTINQVHLTKIWISFGSNFLDVFNENTKYTILFEMSRASARKEHRAVQLVNDYKITKFLFPTREMIKSSCELPELTFFNRAVETNREQKKAVMNIVAGSSYPAPYLLFGPPGTGKTVTLVEAIKQICKVRQDSHILVCTPSNSAANVITERLVSDENFKQPLIRLLAASQEWDQIPDSIKHCTNYDEKFQEFCYPKMEDLMKYRIIVLTLITASRLVDAIFPLKHFTHLFIDECGHSTETEALVPIGNFVSGKATNQIHGHIILAGDPKQLGPIIFSDVAKSYGFGMSLLERLMEKISLYQRNPETHRYDDRVLTKLLKNFRSHEALLRLPNQQFYDNELQACADENITTIALGWRGLPNPNFPIIFHCSFGEEKQDSCSPSYYNPEELNLVKQYLKQIVNCKLNPRLEKIINQSDVGVVSPYKRQVRKIQERCEDLGFRDIEVGSVEQFQGREKLVIIVSTVRSQKGATKSSAGKMLGFLRNEKRFNVALTRAQSLLIVIGNPNVLQYDKHWRSLINYCQRNNAMKNDHNFKQDFHLDDEDDIYDELYDDSEDIYDDWDPDDYYIDQIDDQ